MKTIHINEAFVCLSCNAEVPAASGTCRDHCTTCLCSLHVDKRLPGDRASECHGILRPTHAQMHQKKGIMIYFRCEKCGYTHQNRAAEDDNQETLATLILEANRRASGLNL